jgi:hypothetical protein
MNKGALCRWIQEFLQVEIDRPAVAFGNVVLCLSYRLMGRASGSKPLAVCGDANSPELHSFLFRERPAPAVAGSSAAGRR